MCSHLLKRMQFKTNFPQEFSNWHLVSILILRPPFPLKIPDYLSQRLFNRSFNIQIITKKNLFFPWTYITSFEAMIGLAAGGWGRRGPHSVGQARELPTAAPSNCE